MKTILIICFSIQLAWAEEKIIYEYKKYEKFDLGNLEVDGQLLTPGDITVRERERRKFDSNLFERSHFRAEMIEDLQSLN